MDDLRLRAVHLLRHISAHLDLVGARFAAEHDLHPTDLRAIIHLLDARRAGIAATPGWLSARLGLNSASVTALVDRLARSGHVTRTRDEQDRRRVLLSVRDKALRLGEEHTRATVTDVVAALGNHPDTDVAATCRVLAEVCEALVRGPALLPAGASRGETRLP